MCGIICCGDEIMNDTERLIRIIAEHPELTCLIRKILLQITQQTVVADSAEEHLQ